MAHQSINPNDGKLLKSFEHLSSVAARAGQNLKKPTMDAERPFGGIQQSDYGRQTGRMGIQACVNTKPIRSGHLAAPA